MEPDIFVLFESWLKRCISDAEVAITNCNLFRTEKLARGGGVAVYFKGRLSVEILKSISIPFFFFFLNFIVLKVDLGHNNPM